MALIELKGLAGLNRQQQTDFRQQLLQEGKITEGTSFDHIDRIYRNRKFIDRFGIDAFESMSYKDRDTFFRNSILDEELSKYDDDPNIKEIRNMTPEGQIELFESGYLSTADKQAIYKDADLTENQKKARDKAAFSDLTHNIANKASAGLTIGGGLGMIVGPEGAIAGGVIGTGIGAITGTVESIVNKFASPEKYEDELNSYNAELFEKARIRDIDRKRNSEEVQNKSLETQNTIRNEIEAGNVSYDDVDSMFESIVGNHGTEEDPRFGSNYYERFKDSLLKDLDEGTKIKIVSDFLALQELHPDVAFEGLEQIFQNMVADRQNWKHEIQFAVTRNVTGLTADFAQIPTALIAAGISLVDGDEAARQYLEEGKIGGHKLMAGFDPSYWNKVAKYNTFDPDEIAKSDRAGGITTNLMARRTDESMWNPGTFISESLGQIHYLAYYGIMGRLTGGLGNKLGINMNTNAGIAYQAGATIVPNMSMATQMGYEAMEGTRETLMGKYQEQVNRTVDSLAQEELDKINWNKELQDYKNKHNREGEKILMPDNQLLDMLKNQKLAEMMPSLISRAEAANADVLQEINGQVLDAFRLESAMDIVKNSVEAKTFRSWMYSNNRALQRSIKGDTGFDLRVRGNTYSAPKVPNRRKLYLKAMGKEMLGEAADEFMDGITTGMAEAYNVAQYDGWLANRENPGSLDDMTITFNALASMSLGVRDAFNEDNFYEAAMGAISPFTPTFTRAQVNPYTGRRFWINNAINEEYITELDRYRSAEKRAEAINNFLTENEDRIANIANLDGPNKTKEEALKRGDLKAARDAEFQQLVKVALLYNDANDIAVDADMVQEMNGTIDKLIADRYTDEEKGQLGNEFINQPQNKNSGMTAMEGYEQLRENAQKVVETAQKLDEIQEKINEHPNADKLSSEAKSHIMSLSLQQDDWKERLDEVINDLGISNSNTTELTSKDMLTKAHAEQLKEEHEQYGRELRESAENLNDDIEELQDDIKDIKRSKSLSNKEKQEKIASIENEIEGKKQARRQILKEVDRVSSLLANDLEELENWEENSTIISSDDILHSSAAKIQYMLANKEAFSSEQKAEIDKAITELRRKDPSFWNKIQEAVGVTSALEESQRAIDAIYENPKGYNLLSSRVKYAKVRAQMSVEANRFKEQLFSSWDSMSANEILQDKNFTSKFLEEYMDRNSRARYEELKPLHEIAKFRESLFDLIDDNTDAASANNLIQSVTNITSVANSKDEAINLLNEALKDKTIPVNIREDIENLLKSAEILDRATSATFKQEKEEIEKRKKDLEERERQAVEIAAKQREEAEKRAKEIEEKKKAEREKNKEEIINKAKQEAKKASYRSGYSRAKKKASELSDEDLDSWISELEDRNKKDNLSNYGLGQYKALIDEKTRRSTNPDNKETIEDNGQEVDKEVETIEDDGKEVEEEVETLDDDGQEVAEEVDKIDAGREPVSMEDEAEVLLGITYSSTTESLPSTDEFIERELEEAEKRGSISATQYAEADETSEQVTGKAREGELAGNAYSRYRVIDGVVHLREDVDAKTPGKTKDILKWFDSANIKFQEVIDNELSAIRELDPKVRIAKVRSKVNATNDSVMRDVYMLVVEYTDDIAKIHKTDDSIIESGGVKYLVIGALGYNKDVTSTWDSFKAFTDNNSPLNTRSKEFFNTHENRDERFYVDPIAYTKISNINPGRLVKESEGSPNGVQPISQLLKTAGVQLRNAKWAIVKGSELKVIGNIDVNNIYNNTGILEKPGAVYLLVPSADKRRYIPAYVVPTFTDNINEDSELKQILNSAFARLTSNDHRERYKALMELYQYIHLDGENDQILIGQEGRNTITIIQGGSSKSYNLDDPTISKLAIINELQNSHFRISIRPNYLMDRAMLNMLDEAGVLSTDIQKYGVSGADFNVYDMNAEETPNITDLPERASGKRIQNKQPSVIYNNTPYTKAPTGWRDFNRKKVTDATTIRHLEYALEIQNGKAPYSQTKSDKKYVFSFDRANPIVIVVSNKGVMSQMNPEAALEYLDKQAAIEQEKARERAVDEAMRDTFKEDEDVNLNENIDLNEDIYIQDEMNTKDFESFMYGEEYEETSEEDDSESPTEEPLNPVVPTPNPNRPISTDESSTFTSVKEIMVNHVERFLSIILEKQERGEWLDIPMDSNEELIKYLENKDLEVVGIRDLDAWFDEVKRCR